MKSYVVSIYRVGKSKSRSLVGVVEEVGMQGKKAFTDYDELWEILQTGQKNVRKGTVTRGGDLCNNRT